MSHQDARDREATTSTRDLAGRVALVTGASRGIGRAVALALAEAGADVGVNCRSREREAAEVASEVERRGRRCVVVRADGAVAGDVARMVGAVEEGLGAVSILVNNAGIARPLVVDRITEADWDETIAVNLGLTHSYASLLAGEGITVNAIAPALIETDMIAGNPRARPELVPAGRFGSAEEVAEVAVMLARNAFITGQTVNVNGGFYMS